MQIGLLLAEPDRHSDINQLLRDYGSCEFVRFCLFQSAPPWPDGIYLVDWTILQPEQRYILLECAQQSSCMALIIYAPILSGDDARRMLHGGVADILNSLSDLDAIASAVQHQVTVLEQKQNWISQYQQATETLSVLTRREQDILRALSGGASNKIAARLLGISPRTVEVHRANMLRRTGAGNIVDLLKIQRLMDDADAALRPSPAPLHSADQPCRRDLPEPAFGHGEAAPAPCETRAQLMPAQSLQAEHRRLIYTAAADRMSDKQLLPQ